MAVLIARNRAGTGLRAGNYRKEVGRRILALLAFGFTAALQAGIPAGSIDDFIASESPVSGVPGLAYAVVADGEIRMVGARGVVRMGGDKAVTPDTPFITGSISKSFTALAVMQLVEAGKVGLDIEVSNYLAVFSGKPAGAITIRQLLSHTSGFSTFKGNSSPKDNPTHKDALARAVDRLAGVIPAYPPGAKWEYSNLNYQILGRLIEVVSGQTYQSYIATHILEPVGMAHSFVADGEIHNAMATGHRPWFATKQPLAENKTDLGTAPQGGIVASASDLARYLQMMMNGRDDVLSAMGKAAMMRPAGAASPFYGFGWFVDTGNGTVYHTGNSPGYESLATMVPAENKGVVVLVNAGSGIGFGETLQLRNGIAARALGLDYQGEGSRWSRQTLFISLVLMPVMFLLSMVWAWFHRRELRAKSGPFGRFSLWFPLFTTLGSAWVIFSLMPGLLGASFGTLNLFQPDMGLVLIAIPVTGVLWAVFRLAMAYSGKSGPA
ncbi:MAG: beta-lactamase family protein [Cephaloticoccus sp.]|nr:beta-lactamase family protein [Cephaloticoccus sp.]MCF7759689.1 beta-lactamase family protein [Cephaloticoccus sp.]